MKHAIILFVAFALSFVAKGQEIPKRANVIVVSTPDSSATAFKKAKLALLDQELTLESSDADVFYIKASGKYKRGNMTITVQVKGNQVHYSGNFDGATGSNFPIEYRGQGGSPVMLAWERLEEIARAYPGGQLSYQVK